MKKVSLFLFVLVSVAFSGFSQTTPPTDFYAGKWEIVIAGTPNGDAKMIAELVRKDGKLTGQMTNAAEPNGEKIPITGIVENGDKIAISFTAQGYDLTMDLAKVDDDNLKGTMMNFDTTAKRVKQ
ncbi:hypothetical protein GCM10028805_45870 [Spirosoma harenae]